MLSCNLTSETAFTNYFKLLVYNLCIQGGTLLKNGEFNLRNSFYGTDLTKLRKFNLGNSVCETQLTKIWKIQY